MWARPASYTGMSTHPPPSTSGHTLAGATQTILHDCSKEMMQEMRETIKKKKKQRNEGGGIERRVKGFQEPGVYHNVPLGLYVHLMPHCSPIYGHPVYLSGFFLTHTVCYNLSSTTWLLLWLPFL